MLVVCKFGGSSVATSSQLRKVETIIKEDPFRKVVVTSACGKRFSGDSKVTDLLFLLSAHIKYHADATHIWNELSSRYNEIKTELNIDFDVDSELESIKNRLKENFDENYLVSRGEYLSARLLSKLLNYRFVDAEELFLFDYNGKVDYAKTFENIKTHIYPNENVVVPGFYGVNPDGSIHLFSRGGSDVTGSILASALDASKYENWTDVNGILMVDPRIIPNPKRVACVNYDELRELSYMGASVIHDETLIPLMGKDIPIHILNTNDKDDKGTVISNNVNDSSSLLSGITGKKDYLTITISKEQSVSKTDVISDSINILRSYSVNIEHIPTSIDSFSLVVEAKQVKKHLYEIIGKIKNINGVIDVNIDNDIALVALIGRNMATKVGISGKIFSILGKAGINVKIIAQGTKELTIIIGVSNDDFKRCIVELYNNLA